MEEEWRPINIYTFRNRHHKIYCKTNQDLYKDELRLLLHQSKEYGIYNEFFVDNIDDIPSKYNKYIICTIINDSSEQLDLGRFTNLHALVVNCRQDPIIIPKCIQKL